LIEADKEVINQSNTVKITSPADEVNDQSMTTEPSSICYPQQQDWKNYPNISKPNTYKHMFLRNLNTAERSIVDFEIQEKCRRP
jgi:hypothetical protein